MPTEIDSLFDDKSLLKSPVMRAAYSDRTAWLMAAMSELAYYKFEDGERITEIAKELAKLSGVTAIKSRLDELLQGTIGGGNEANLRRVLDMAGFELIRTYDRSETQAFLAKRKDEDGTGMLVLAFRGTEMKPKDIFADAYAVLTTLEGEEKVHNGFLTAFEHVRDAIKKDLAAHPGIPVYITGHSLGGALAVLATRLLASESQGACYTFGGPRVGTANVDDQIKTPIYRIVNSADLVPRVPPSASITILIMLANLFHLTPVASFLRRFKDYVHYGDMRYLTHVDPGQDDRFSGLTLHSNPSFFLRAQWVVRRWIATSGKAGLTDHSISLYRRKLKAYAIARSTIGAAPKPQAAAKSAAAQKASAKSGSTRKKEDPK